MAKINVEFRSVSLLQKETIFKLRKSTRSSDRIRSEG